MTTSSGNLGRRGSGTGKENLDAVISLFRNGPLQTERTLTNLTVARQAVRANSSQLLQQLPPLLQQLRVARAAAAAAAAAASTSSTAATAAAPSLADQGKELAQFLATAAPILQKLDPELPEAFAAVEADLARARQQLAAHATHLQELQQSQREGIADSQLQRRHFRQKFDLLKNVTGITWGHHATDILGVVSYPTSATLRPFSIPLAGAAGGRKTQFEVVQELWAQAGEVA